jgi:1-phosphofructokinase
MLSVTIEARGEGRDDVHCHPGGQGVWLSKMAAELGAWPVLCSLIGGETGDVLESLLERLGGELRLVRSDSSSGCYVTDRRSGEREVLAQAYVEPPSRHEADELVAQPPRPP